MVHLKIVNLSKQFDGKDNTSLAVKDFSLEVKKGEFVTLLGPSGCGKTTVLRIVAGLETPTAGSIYIRGKDIAILPPNKRSTAMVFQHYALFPHMDVYNNVAFGLRFKKKLKKNAIAGRVKEFLGLVGLDGLERRMPQQLSGGQQQRVAIARALVTEPDVLLFDEPLSNLDKDLRIQMRSEIRRLHDKTSSTAIYVTHDNDEALALADRVVKMKHGEIESISQADRLCRQS